MRRFFRGNIGEHVLALVLALVLWFFVKSTLEPSRQSDTASRNFGGIPIEMRNRPQDMEVVMQGAGSVTLTLRGAPDIIGRITMDDLLAYIDLRSMEEGRHQLSVRVDLPAGIEVTAVSPARLEVELERILSSQTTVTLVRSGEPQPGYYAPVGTIEPEVVLVTGPRSSIGEMVAFFVVVDISRATSTLVSTVTLLPLDAEGQVIENLNITPEEVTYTQPIYPTKVVPLRAVLLDAEGEAYELSVAPAEFNLAGTQETLEAIEEIVLEFSLADVVDGQYVGALDLPAGVLLLEPDTPAVLVTVTLVEE
jgi:YbbR domain-containing protein